MQSPNKNNGGPEPEIEHIADDERVSRCWYSVDGLALHPATALQFSSDNVPPRCESAYWRKYAPLPADVAERGMKAMEPGNKRREAKGKKPWQYIGAHTGRVGDIRLIQTDRGFSFTVEHVPEEGDRAHTHITLKAAANSPKPKPADKSELVDKLLAAMPFEAYKT